VRILLSFFGEFLLQSYDNLASAADSDIGGSTEHLDNRDNGMWELEYYSDSLVLVIRLGLT